MSVNRLTEWQNTELVPRMWGVKSERISVRFKLQAHFSPERNHELEWVNLIRLELYINDEEGRVHGIVQKVEFEDPLPFDSISGEVTEEIMNFSETTVDPLDTFQLGLAAQVTTEGKLRIQLGENDDEEQLLFELTVGSFVIQAKRRLEEFEGLLKATGTVAMREESS